MSKQLYAVNKTDGNLQLKRGFFHIHKDGYKEVMDSDLEHPDFDFAKGRGWIEITDEKPADHPLHRGVKPIEAVTPYQGMTLAELRASEAEDKKVSGATSSAIGKPIEEEVAPIVVETTEPASEATTKAKKKAAEKAAE